MCHLSPTVHLAWAVLTCGLLVFLIQHLWRYDRFKCLSWSGGKQPGAFKRVMTYSYITSVPALTVYAVSMAVLKYRNGYADIPAHGVVPTPFYLWIESDRAWLQPLYIIFGIVWGLELVTHLEELMFWLFLLHQGPDRRDWFTSVEFKLWATGSCIAMAGLPLTAVIKRADPLSAEAYLFLVGSLSSFIITVLFFIVLVEFPKFLRRVKREGAATPVILRLVTFHELNILRIIFRLLMTVPLIILGADGVSGHRIINEKALWTDLLAFLAAVGTVVSSTMTLLIFFPRSLAEDSNWRPRSAESQSRHSLSRLSRITTDHRAPRKTSLLDVKPNRAHIASGSFPELLNNPKGSGKVQPFLVGPLMDTRNSKHYDDINEVLHTPPTTPYYPPKNFYEEDYRSLNNLDRRNQCFTSESSDRKVNHELHELHDEPENNPSPNFRIRLIELGEVIDQGMRRPSRPPRLHPYIASFTSPIDLPGENDFIPRAI